MKTVAFLTTALITNAAAFAPINQGTQHRVADLQATKNSYDPLNLAAENEMKMDSIPKIAAASAAALALSPLAALAGKLICVYITLRNERRMNSDDGSPCVYLISTLIRF